MYSEGKTLHWDALIWNQFVNSPIGNRHWVVSAFIRTYDKNKQMLGQCIIVSKLKGIAKANGSKYLL